MLALTVNFLGYSLEIFLSDNLRNDICILKIFNFLSRKLFKKKSFETYFPLNRYSNKEYLCSIIN